MKCPECHSERVADEYPERLREGAFICRDCRLVFTSDESRMAIRIAELKHEIAHLRNELGAIRDLTNQARTDNPDGDILTWIYEKCDGALADTEMETITVNHPKVRLARSAAGYHAEHNLGHQVNWDIDSAAGRVTVRCETCGKTGRASENFVNVGGTWVLPCEF